MSEREETVVWMEPPQACMVRRRSSSGTRPAQNTSLGKRGGEGRGGASIEHIWEDGSQILHTVYGNAIECAM